MRGLNHKIINQQAIQLRINPNAFKGDQFFNNYNIVKNPNSKI